MTGGRVVVLGHTGRNFAAGMSGGIAYVIDWDGEFESRCNREMVELGYLEDPDEADEVRSMIEKHARYTSSKLAHRVLAKWDDTRQRIVKILPRDYKQVLEAIRQVEAAGLSGDEAVMAAFEMNTQALVRASGN